MASQEMAEPLDALAPCSHARAESGCTVCKVWDISVCAALDASEPGSLQAIAEAIAEDVHYRKGETILLQGDAADAVYSITHGTVCLYKLLPDGRRQIIGFRLPGDFIYLALPDQYPFS